MKQLPIALAAALSLAATALCDDPPPVPAPAPADGAKPEAPKPDAGKPEAKKERKVDPAAMKALERHLNSTYLPASSGIKALSAKGDFEAQGMTFGINPTWNAEKGFDFTVAVPDEAKEMAKAQGATDEQIQAEVTGQFRGLVFLVVGLNSTFEAPGRNWEHFDVAVKTQGDDEIVTLTPFDDKADADSRTYTFGKDGLLKSISMDPKADSEDPQMQQMKSMGLTFDSSFKYEKRGDRSVITSRTLTIGPQEFTATFSYFGADKGPWFVKDATFSLPDGDHVISLHDYTVDGKLVESTKAAPKMKEAKSADPAPKPEEPKKDEPAPAPKDDPK